MANKLYVIVFTAILSNAQIISQNENNRYVDDRHGAMVATAAMSLATDAAAGVASATAMNAPTVTAAGMGSTAAASSSSASTAPEKPLPHGFNANDDSEQPPESAISSSSSSSLPSINDDGFMNESGSRAQAAAVLGVDDGLYTLRPPELTAINHFKDVSLEQTAAVVAAAAAAAAAAINNDDIAADGFQELSLENGGDDSALDGDLDGPATPREQNIYKVARNNKAKIGKALRHESTKMMATANAMLSAEAFASGSNGSIFNHITNLYDQFQWGMSDIGKSVTRKCANDMATYLRALDKGQTWALQASDSSGRYRGQFLFGNDNWLGSFTFCDELKREVDLEYFLAVVAIPYHHDAMGKGHSLYLGQCLPKTCSLSDIKNILSLDPTVVWLNARSTHKITVNSVRRVPGDYNFWDDGFFHFFVVITTLFGLLAIIATIYEQRFNQANNSDSSKPFKKGQLDYDMMKAEKIHANGQNFELQQIAVENNNEVRMNTNGQSAAAGVIGVTNGHSKNGVNGNGDKILTKKDLEKLEHNQTIQQQLLFSFALGSNLKTIFSMKTLSQDSIPVIHGMKVLSLLWIIMAHSYLQLFGTSENKFSRTILERTSFSYQFISNATYAVDTFFFLSGLLVTMLFWRTNSKNPKIPDLRSGAKQTALLFIYRYMRLTPAFLMVIVMDTIWLKHTYDSAVFPVGLSDHTICPKYWWRNILYIHTWYPFNEFCMIWSWYLGNDMQYYVWSVILMITSIRHPKTVLTIITSTLIASWMYTAYVSLQLNYSLRISEPLGTFGVLYEKPWARIGPYVMGMVAGYIIHNYKTPPKMTKNMHALLWFCSVVTLFLVVFGVWNGSLSVGWTAIYVSLSHTAWGLALIWITLACKWNIAGPINKMLSLRCLLPLSRLTYCAYLIHPVTQIVMAFQLKGTLYITHGLVLTIFVGNTVFSYFCAMVISVLFEAPIVRILKILFGK